VVKLLSSRGVNHSRCPKQLPEPGSAAARGLLCPGLRFSAAATLLLRGYCRSTAVQVLSTTVRLLSTLP